MTRAARGELAIVLHSHMPYVEGFGTWPFGEEWLWEAMATSYLPLLGVLDGRVTLSLTPVLCDQLEAPGIGERFETFLREVRRASHEFDARGCRDSGRPDLAGALERAAGQYERALRLFDGDPLGALAPHAAWTSSATHAVLPLVATDAGVRLQVQTGVASHRARFGEWRGGFWLPECAHAPWLDPLLEEAGVHATCVDLTDVAGVDPLTPLHSAAGPLLVGIDREVVELVWSDAGYPAGAAYRDYHHRTTHDHHPWAIDGDVYDRERALAQVRSDAADFVGRVRARVAGGGLSVCALDTELLGHWWHEGVDWLAAVLVEADAQGLAISTLDDALERHPAVAAPDDLPTTTWGRPRTLHTWDGPQVSGLAWGARRAELDVVDAVGRGTAADPDLAVRELLARQASDWAFIATFGLADDYPQRRAAEHETRLRDALVGSGESSIRNLAPHASVAPLRQP